jgi:hypothetical protein
MTTVRHGDSRAAEDPKPPKGGRSEAVRSSLPAVLWQNAGQYVSSARRGLTGVNAAIMVLNQNPVPTESDLKRALARSRE